MSVQQYALLLRERWLTVLIVAMVGIGAGAAAFALLPAEYTANTSLYVSTRLTDTTAAAYQGALLSQVQTKSYTEMVTSPRVTTEVVARLGLQTSPEGLASQVTATSAADSAVIQVSVTDRSPDRAAQIANAVGDVFAGEIQDAESSTGPDAGTSLIQVQVWEPAVTPSTRSSLGLRSLLLLGFFVGLVVGVAIAVVRKALDSSVRSAGQLTRISGAPVLGILPDGPPEQRQPSALRQDSPDDVAHALRRLRTHLELLEPRGAHRVFAITSSVPAEGKTTIAVNLGKALGSVGRRVLLVESDLRRPVLAELLQLDGRLGLAHVIADEVHLTEAIQTFATNVDVMPAGTAYPKSGGGLGAEVMRARLEELRHAYDIVLVDCPALLSVADAAAVRAATDGAIVVARYRRVTEPEFAAALDILRAESVPVIGTVLTMAPPRIVRQRVPTGGQAREGVPARTDGRRPRHMMWDPEDFAGAPEPKPAPLSERA